MWSRTKGCSGNSSTRRTANGRCLGKEQQVVGQVEIPQPGDAGAEVRSQHERVVRLVVDDVADTDELRVPRVSRELVADLRRAQVHPADDAPDERVRVGELQEPLGLLDHLPRLDGDRAVEAGRAEPRLEVGG